jgi:hypothetical protein
MRSVKIKEYQRIVANYWYNNPKLKTSDSGQKTLSR